MAPESKFKVNPLTIQLDIVSSGAFIIRNATCLEQNHFKVRAFL